MTITIIKQTGYMTPWFHENFEGIMVKRNGSGITPTHSFHMNKKFEKEIFKPGFEFVVGNKVIFDFEVHPHGAGVRYKIKETWHSMEEYEFGPFGFIRKIDNITRHTPMHKKFFPDGSFEINGDVVIDYVSKNIKYDGMTIDIK